MTTARIGDPLHMAAPTNAAWTAVNISEAFPGVPTPLSWTFFEPSLEFCFRAVFADLGVLSRKERRLSNSIDQRCAAVFYGHPALNLDLFREMADRTPGSSGDAIEQQMFGSVVTSGRPSSPSYSRLPMIALKAPMSMARLPGLIRTSNRSTQAWWQSTMCGLPAAPGAARALLESAATRMREAFRQQLAVAFVAQALFDRLTQVVLRYGDEGMLAQLSSGYSSLAEVAMLSDLWKVSRGIEDLGWFLDRHGYHGHHEGELSSQTWRENPNELATLMNGFRERSEDPRREVRDRMSKRVAAERELVSRAPWQWRPPVDVLLRLTRAYVPLREDGKASFLRIVDVARAAARSLGAAAVEAGLTQDVDDIFYLTVAEALSPSRAQEWSAVPERRRRREDYQRMQLPEVWEGAPPVEGVADIVSESTDLADKRVRGLMVTPGVIESTARVIVGDRPRDDFSPGEILICETTDPSWAPLFYLAAGVVIDTGGPMSHGAIVARELGIPCIINTRSGTRTVRDGDLVRLDAAAGELVVLERAI